MFYNTQHESRRSSYTVETPEKMKVKSVFYVLFNRIGRWSQSLTLVANRNKIGEYMAVEDAVKNTDEPNNRCFKQNRSV